MSKVGQWVFEMQEDACQMNLAEFIEKHGYSRAEIWNDIHFGNDQYLEPDFEMEMDDGA